MNEINLNPLSRSVGVDKSSSSTAAPKSSNIQKSSSDSDSMEFSQLPNLSAVEESLEQEFAGSRLRLEKDANSPSYPSVEIIDRLAAMLAINLDPKSSGQLE